jgi:chemotaxis protein MotB
VTARRARRLRHEAPRASQERWLVSYADFITLLFAFFATMYAISTVDAQKLASMVDSMHTAFDTRGVPRPAAVPRPSGAPERMRQDDLVQRLRERLDSTSVNVELDQRGIVVSMREAGSFPTGSADLSPVARDVLRELAAMTGGDEALKLRVEGHTDDVPIQTGRFASNWELSTARATTVVTYLVQQLGVAPQRLSAAGYGEFHPRVPNASVEDRAQNRRVDIIILNEGTAKAEEPPSAAASPARGARQPSPAQG